MPKSVIFGLELIVQDYVILMKNSIAFRDLLKPSINLTFKIKVKRVHLRSNWGSGEFWGVMTGEDHTLFKLRAVLSSYHWSKSINQLKLKNLKIMVKTSSEEILNVFSVTWHEGSNFELLGNKSTDKPKKFSTAIITKGSPGFFSKIQMNDSLKY